MVTPGASGSWLSRIAARWSTWVEYVGGQPNTPGNQLAAQSGCAQHISTYSQVGAFVHWCWFLSPTIAVDLEECSFSEQALRNRDWKDFHAPHKAALATTQATKRQPLMPLAAMLQLYLHTFITSKRPLGYTRHVFQDPWARTVQSSHKNHQHVMGTICLCGQKPVHIHGNNAISKLGSASSSLIPCQKIWWLAAVGI